MDPYFSSSSTTTASCLTGDFLFILTTTTTSLYTENRERETTKKKRRERERDAFYTWVYTYSHGYNAHSYITPLENKTIILSIDTNIHTYINTDIGAYIPRMYVHVSVYYKSYMSLYVYGIYRSLLYITLLQRKTLQSSSSSSLSTSLVPRVRIRLFANGWKRVDGGGLVAEKWSEQRCFCGDGEDASGEEEERCDAMIILLFGMLLTKVRP